MQIRHWLSVVSVFSLAAAISIAGEPFSDLYGGPCPKGEESQGGSTGDSGKDLSDPIYLATGDFQHTQTDLFIPGRGLDFEIRRSYRSRSGMYSSFTTQHNPLNLDGLQGQEPRLNSPLGANWDFKYNMRLDIGELYIIESPDPVGFDQPLPSKIFLHDGTGRRDEFNFESLGTFQPSVGNPAVYANDAFDVAIEYTFKEWSVYLIDSSQVRYEFLPFFNAQADFLPDTAADILPYAGRLSTITDRNGNRISFTYETSNGVERIASAKDTLGHDIFFYYHDDPSSPLSGLNPAHTAPLLWQIVDHAGRVVEYDFEGVTSSFTAQLTEVVQPSIEATPDFQLIYLDGSEVVNHGRFPNGIVWKYEYAPQASGWFNRGMITKITDPNGIDIIQNEYNISSNDLRRSGRVTRQQYGDDAYNYVVTGTDGGIADQGSNYDYYVWVNDRRGAITRLKYGRRYNPSYPDVPGADAPRDRQLIEKTEFLGFVSNPDQRVWATYDTNGDIVAWKYFDANGVPQTLASGPLDNGQPGEAFTTTFIPDRNWNIGGIVFPSRTSPGGNSNGQTYKNHDYPLPPGTPVDPRFNKTVTSRTMSSPAGTVPMESITEYWRYDFDFGGGGCGCGSSGFETAYQDGKGYVTIKKYDTAVDPLTGNASGDLLAIYHDLPIGTSMETLPAVAAGLAAAVDEYTYNEWGQVLTHTHPKKRILDSQGAEQIHRRTDSYTYYNTPSDPANHGRLHTKTVDTDGQGFATPKNLTTVYEYDLIGNVSKVTDPSGDVTMYLYNQASQLVRERHFDNALSLFAETMYFYDANGNVVVEELKNLDGNQAIVSGNKWITTVHEFDSLDFRTVTSRELGLVSGIFSAYTGQGLKASTQIANTQYVSKRWSYDANRNLSKFENGEALSGNDLYNIVAFDYDARDLMIKEVRGEGGVAPLTIEYEFDETDRLVFTRVNPASTLQTQETELVYDVFNRVIERIDPMGNQYLYKYDDNHNPVELRVCGPVNQDTDTGGDVQSLLAVVTRSYGELDLMNAQSFKVYDYDHANGTGPICEDDLTSFISKLTTYSYNENSSYYEIHASSGDPILSNVTTIHYDTASRVASEMDGVGNITQYKYDADSNVTNVDLSDISSTDSTTEEFKVEYEYDALNRQIARIDGVGNRTKTWFDSRSNVVEQVDERENIHTYTYDSLSRMVGTSTTMTDTGEGTGTQLTGADGTISTTRIYDASSRIVSESDDNGNSTLYEYDDLNRMTKITMPDGQFYTAAYDFNGNVATYTDARGVVVTQFFDRNNRLYQRNITGAAVPGTTEEHFTYDGLGRLREASNDFAEVTREYDSRSNVIREIQNIDAANGFPTTSDQVVAYEFDIANNNSKIVYPDNIRSIYRTHDELNRLVGIFNDQTFLDPISEFGYIGTRLKNRIHGNGTQTEYGYNGISDGSGNAVGDFGFGRIATISTTNTVSTNVLDAFEFAWDKSQNRISYKDTGSGMKNRRQRTFGYDSANRLTSTDVDYPDPLTDYTSPTNNGITTYTLDGVHNRTDVSGYESNGAPLGPYNQSGNQALNNQYTITPREGGGSWTYLYDENGNMVLKAQYNVADFTGNYVLDFFDLSAFMAAHTALEPSADLNDDGIWDFFDVSIFLGIFVNGATLDNVHYSYDFRNQLVGIEFKNGITVSHTVTNTYDPMARRVVEEITEGVNVESKQMVYGGASLWEVIEQIDLSTDDVLLTHVYGFGIDDEVSYRIENQLTPEDIWTHRDDLNSLTSISNDNGDILERYEYGDYGQVSFFNAAGLSIPAPAYNAHHLYTGRSLITGTGLYDYRFRVMDPETGRFVQRDPLGYIDSLNLYSYATLNPTRFTDPLGLSITIAIPTDAEGKEHAMRLADAIERLCPNVKVDRTTGKVTYTDRDNSDCDDETKELCALLDELINNDKNNIINVSEGMRILKNAQTHYTKGENGENLGTEIEIHPDTKINDKELVLDPDTGTYTVRKLDRTKSVDSTLAHELGHALDHNRNGDYAPGDAGYTRHVPGGYSRKETTAIHYENQQRIREGLPPRNFY